MPAGCRELGLSVCKSPNRPTEMASSKQVRVRVVLVIATIACATLLVLYPNTLLTVFIYDGEGLFFNAGDADTTANKVKAADATENKAFKAMEHATGAQALPKHLPPSKKGGAQVAIDAAADLTNELHTHNTANLGTPPSKSPAQRDVFVKIGAGCLVLMGMAVVVVKNRVSNQDPSAAGYSSINVVGQAKKHRSGISVPT